MKPFTTFRTIVSCALFGCAALAAQTSAATALDPLTFLPACLTPAQDVEAAATTLEQAVWRIRTPVPEAAIAPLTWIDAAFYFSGDSGGETLDNILALKEKSARGLVRKKDIPASKTRILTNETGGQLEVLALMWRQPAHGVTEIECHAALAPASTQFIRAELGNTEPLPAFHLLEPSPVDGGTLNITLLNPTTLEGRNAPDAVVLTYLITRGGN